LAKRGSLGRKDDRTGLTAKAPLNLGHNQPGKKRGEGRTNGKEGAVEGCEVARDTEVPHDTRQLTCGASRCTGTEDAVAEGERRSLAARVIHHPGNLGESGGIVGPEVLT
jgi:hypothetical protein